MSSSSSDSEDENLVLLRQAVDTNFICDGMFSAASTSEKIASNKSSLKTELHTSNALLNTSTQQQLKSQRYIEHDEIEADLNVSKSMQDFVYKKMSKKIDDSIEFVETPTKKSKKRKVKDEESSCVRLLSDTDPIKIIDIVPETSYKPLKGRKLEVKRRVIEPDAYNGEEKLKLALVNGEVILQQTETKNWKSKVKPKKVFSYREKNSILYEIEVENEFTALRKRNNWSESKISNFPWKNHKK